MKPIRRASSMDRVLTCYASPAVLEKVGERPRPDGHEGVYGHWLIAKRAIEELGALPPEGGLQPPQVPRGYKFPKASLWMVDWAIRHIRETIPDDWSLMVEQEFIFEFGQWIASGHTDIVAQSPDGKRINAKDWKFVFVPVDDAEENDQILTYLVLLKKAWPETEEIEFEICSPRLSQDERITVVTVNGDDLDRCADSLDSRMNIALDNSTKLKTSLKGCKWCVGCSCPAIQEEAKLMEMELTPEMLASLKSQPDDAKLADFVISARTLRKPIEDATEMLHERLDQNPVISAGCGMTVSRKIQRGDYKIPDPVAFMQAVRIVLPEDERIARVMTPSMTRIIDEIADRNNVPKTGKSAVTGTSIFEGHLRPLVEQGEKRILVIS